ncbi:Ldh family oxidoreductase [Faunimonas sp. B44]|uniref:Ldh family oxidoreductase n=1 Tax=Faunimonas sp. B44 TaxID=3461493 RepID=UPI0040448521
MTQQEPAPGQPPETVYADPEAARRFVTALLETYDLPAADARIVAQCLVRADLRGVDTHGLMRLPGYLDRLRRGLVNARPNLKPRRVMPAVAHLDGEDGLGFVVATRAMAEAMAIAREMGIGMVSAKRSTHFGMAATYLLQAIEAGFIALVFTNASRAMPPWGGREALLGTSPFAAGAPGGEKGPFILDMAPSVAARGKIRRAIRLGEPIPIDYALDADGKPTTDPVKALAGVVLPMGGPKGSGLSMLMDILGGVISGAGFAGDVADQYKDYTRAQNVGHFFLAIKPDLFMSAEEYRQRMDVLVERVKAVPLAEGFEEILMPGEPEARQEQRRLGAGIPYQTKDLEPLQEDARARGVPPLATRATPLDA